MSDPIITCDACPVLCRIRPGRTGACDRYGNIDGVLTRMDPLLVTQKIAGSDGKLVPFLSAAEVWDGSLVRADKPVFVTGIGATTTYPDYKPAPFIVSSEHEGIDMVTVVSEGVFSYCGVKIKIDTDRYIGPEPAPVRAQGEQIGHVTTAEYGSQMLAIGGVRHLTGGTKKEGNATCAAMLALCNKEPVRMSVDGGATLTVQAGEPPVIDGDREERMRVGCGSATIGIFAPQWHGHVDEVIVVDDHITGVLTEHQSGKFLDMPAAGIRVRGRRSTPGRYFQVAEHGSGWGGTDVTDPLSIIEKIDDRIAWPGLKLLMVSTTGQDAAYFELDDALMPVEEPIPADLQVVVERIGENCEPALSSVLFMGGAGGSLRAGGDRQSGPSDPFDQTPRHARDLRRRAGLCLARRRDHGHARCHDHAGQRLRLRPDPRRWWRRSSSPCRTRSSSISAVTGDAVVSLEEGYRPWSGTLGAATPGQSVADGRARHDRGGLSRRRGISDP